MYDSADQLSNKLSIFGSGISWKFWKSLLCVNYNDDEDDVAQ